MRVQTEQKISYNDNQDLFVNHDTTPGKSMWLGGYAASGETGEMGQMHSPKNNMRTQIRLLCTIKLAGMIPMHFAADDQFLKVHNGFYNIN